MDGDIRIQAPSALSATELARAIAPFTRPRVAKIGPGRWEVRIDDSSEATLNRVIGTVEGWLSASRMRATVLRFRGREFGMTPPAGAEIEAG